MTKSSYPKQEFLEYFGKTKDGCLPFQNNTINPADFSRKKLIGNKYPLDSEFLSGHTKLCTFSKSKKGLVFKDNKTPGPTAYQVNTADKIVNKSHPKVVFAKTKKTFYADELPRTQTPGPIYTYKKSVLST